MDVLGGNSISNKQHSGSQVFKCVLNCHTVSRGQIWWLRQRGHQGDNDGDNENKCYDGDNDGDIVDQDIQ